MPLLRTLTVTAATGLCLLGTGLPAAYADTTPQSGALVRATKSAPWKHHVRTVKAPLVTVVAPAPTQAVTVVDPNVTFAQRIAVLINVERAAAGLAPLKVSTCATGFASTWSQHMADTADFSHQSLTPMMSSCGARGAGENIAYGATSPEQFMTMWMNSAGHKANILRETFTHVGVGIARTPGGTLYATQDFLTL
ncbi:MAG: CAP domain-containing protein [Actinobacteria bacterium]|nr:CAP domain-containing protein [Actinomycetota bacterium]MCA1719992.1 CAP domain-containing protein [Actinomycetota bacterium]